MSQLFSFDIVVICARYCYCDQTINTSISLSRKQLCLTGNPDIDLTWQVYQPQPADILLVLQQRRLKSWIEPRMISPFDGKRISGKDTDLSHWCSLSHILPNFVAGFLEFPDSLISQRPRLLLRQGFTELLQEICFFDIQPSPLDYLTPPPYTHTPLFFSSPCLSQLTEQLNN